MATTLGGISFEELDASPRISIGPAGATAERRFRVAWSDWHRFAQELMGVYQDVGGAVRYGPGVPFPGERPQLFCEALEIEPFDPSQPDGAAVSTLTSGTNAYAQGALVVARYRQQFDNAASPGAPAPPDGTFLSYSADLASEYLTLPDRNWKWSALGEDLPGDLGLGLVDPAQTHTLTWHRVTRPPWSAIRALRGALNADLVLGAGPGQLLFAGCRARSAFRVNDQFAIWDLEYTFLERSHPLNSGARVGWNYFFNSKPSGGEHWQLVVARNGGETPYPAGANFHSLFLFG